MMSKSFTCCSVRLVAYFKNMVVAYVYFLYCKVETSLVYFKL